MMKKFIPCVLIICMMVTGSLSCSDQQEPTTPNGILKILFIGNSLTYTNDLPKLVEEAASLRDKDIITEMVAHPNYGLEDHWNDGIIQKMINTNEYQYVVIQQGPSSQTYGRNSLFEFGEKIQELCKENNSQLAYYMVWPAINYYHTFEGVIKNYSEAASANNATLFPVGRVWKEYFDTTNDFSYYGSDGFHPSLQGSQVAAEVIADLL